MEWIKLSADFDTEQKARQRAQIVAATEARLSNAPSGPQYQIETKIENNQGQWQVFWRKIFIGYRTGCGKGCSSCRQQPPASPAPPTNHVMGKVIPFKRNNDQNDHN